MAKEELSTRVAMLSVVTQLHASTVNNINLVFQNFPKALLRKKIRGDDIFKHGITITQLAGIFDKADSKLRLPLNLINSDSNAEPDAHDIENITVALKTIVFVQEQLKMVRQVYSTEEHDLGMKQQTGSAWDEQEKKKAKGDDTNDVNIRHKDASGRFILDGAEQKMLDIVDQNISNYLVAISQLLGVTLQESSMEGDYPTYKIMHSELSPLEGSAPPKPWAEKMKTVKVSMPIHESDAFHRRG